MDAAIFAIPKQGDLSVCDNWRESVYWMQLIKYFPASYSSICRQWQRVSWLNHSVGLGRKVGALIWYFVHDNWWRKRKNTKSNLWDSVVKSSVTCMCLLYSLRMWYSAPYTHNNILNEPLYSHVLCIAHSTVHYALKTPTTMITKSWSQFKKIYSRTLCSTNVTGEALLLLSFSVCKAATNYVPKHSFHVRHHHRQ